MILLKNIPLGNKLKVIFIKLCIFEKDFICLFSFSKFFNSLSPSFGFLFTEFLFLFSISISFLETRNKFKETPNDSHEAPTLLLLEMQPTVYLLKILWSIFFLINIVESHYVVLRVRDYK